MGTGDDRTRRRARARWLVGTAVALLATSVAGIPATGGSSPPRSSEPVVDVAAPWFWDGDAGARAGADADRFELDDLPDGLDLSDWYHVAFVDGGRRLQVRDHVPPTTTGAGTAIAQSERVAWRVATRLGGESRLADDGELPSWARPRTGTTDGPSAGLVFVLADLDLVTAGRIGGDLRIAGTGAIGSDGTVTAVRMVDAKLAAARAGGADVFFTPERPSAAPAAAIASHAGRPAPERTIGDWLATAAYEAAGRAARGTPPGTAAVVVVDDVRQAIAWLCGRTQLDATCAVAHAAAGAALGAARPLSSTVPSPTAATVHRRMEER